MLNLFCSVQVNSRIHEGIVYLRQKNFLNPPQDYFTVNIENFKILFFTYTCLFKAHYYFRKDYETVEWISSKVLMKELVFWDIFETYLLQNKKAKFFNWWRDNFLQHIWWNQNFLREWFAQSDLTNILWFMSPEYWRQKTEVIICIVFVIHNYFMRSVCCT